MKILVVVDMQNDFIYGSLGSLLTQNVVDNVVAKVEEYKENGDMIIFTRDTHHEHYLDTPEGMKLPVEHCIRGTEGWEIIPELNPNDLSAKWAIVDKPIFGSVDLMDYFDDNDEIEFCGVCTDICVVSNALMAKSFYPDAKISVDPKCCAGTSLLNHLSAIDVMRSCQIDIIESEEPILEKELVR